jgi:serine/threonine protein kinase/Tol biopolymer transport system component
MALSPGTRLGPYEILASIGAGGMGEVYRAKDTRLDRIVAIKVLVSRQSADTERKKRFEREARAISSLTHPHICTLHDIGQHEGTDYLVMEYLEGESMAQRLDKGALPAEQVLLYGTQIAEALDKAHRQGIVHRDLKPGNIMLTKSGTKLLDFGLAKYSEAKTSEAIQSEMETKSKPLTEEGVLLGTVQYMAPEQLEGKEVDKRTDIFALGEVLYEMATGQRAFAGQSKASLISAILTSEPKPVSTVVPLAPPALDHVVTKCLAKDPDDRWQDAGDVAGELKWVAESRSHSASPMTASDGLWKSKQLLLIGLLLVSIGLGSYFAGKRQGFEKGKTSSGEIKTASIPSFYQLTYRRGAIHAARFAPDGQSIFYSAAWDANPPELFTTRVYSPESLDLGVAGGDALAVSVSNEMAVSVGCRYFNFVLCSGTLASKSLTGGAPREILEDVQQTDWATDGTQLMVLHGSDGHNRLEFPIGKKLYEAAGWLSHARVSPKGDLVAFLEHPAPLLESGYVEVVDLAGKSKRLSGPWATVEGLAWSPTGNEIWFAAADAGASRSLYAVTLSGQQRLIASVPGGLTLYDISKDGKVLAAQHNARMGVLVLTTGQSKERDLSWLDFSWPVDLSDDGQHLLLIEQSEASGPNGSVYVRKTDGSSFPVRLGEGLPLAFSPDGKWALSLLPSPTPQLLLLPTGPGEMKRMPRGSITSYQLDAAFFPDGKQIVFGGSETGHEARLYMQDMEGGNPRPISPEGVSLSLSVQNPISPDGKSVAALGPDGKMRLYPVEGGEPREIPAMVQGEVVARWSADGRSLFVYNFHELPSKLFRIDLLTQRRELRKEFMPSDPAGLMEGMDVVLTPDEKSYAYGYSRNLSKLYLIDGLK